MQLSVYAPKIASEALEGSAIVFLENGLKYTMHIPKTGRSPTQSALKNRYRVTHIRNMHCKQSRNGTLKIWLLVAHNIYMIHIMFMLYSVEILLLLLSISIYTIRYNRQRNSAAFAASVISHALDQRPMARRRIGFLGHLLHCSDWVLGSHVDYPTSATFAVKVPLSCCEITRAIVVAKLREPQIIASSQGRLSDWSRNRGERKGLYSRKDSLHS